MPGDNSDQKESFGGENESNSNAPFSPPPPPPSSSMMMPSANAAMHARVARERDRVLARVAAGRVPNPLYDITLPQGATYSP